MSSSITTGTRTIIRLNEAYFEMRLELRITTEMFFVCTDNASCARLYTRGHTIRPVALSVRTDNVSSSIKTAI